MPGFLSRLSGCRYRASIGPDDEGGRNMATTTFRLGEMVVHRIIEMECGFTPALEFLPKLTPTMLDESRPWMKSPLALDDQDRLVLCFQAYIVRTGKHIV